MQGSGVRGTARGQFLEPDDDWLGDISEYDWSENAAEHSEHGHASPSREGLVAAVDDAGWPMRDPVDADEARRAVVQRRRILAGLALAVVLGVVIAISLVLLRGGTETPVAEPATTTSQPSSGTSPPTGTSPPSSEGADTTPSTPTPTPSTAPPSKDTGSSFTLSEGTKLRLGEGDPELIRQLQRALIAAGYDPGSADGSFGPLTEAAVTAFQQDNSLSADGVVGPETASALNSASEDTAPSTASPSTAPPSKDNGSSFTLPEGTKLQLGEGDPAAVSELQQALTSAGYDPGPADGTFGPRTAAAVTAFQQDNGLSADGVVGPETASALNSAISSG